MDATSPLALATIPVLLVPVGRVRRSTWETYTSLFAAVDSLPQSDVPLDGTLLRARFFPSLSSSFAASTSATGAGGGGGALVKNNNNNTIQLSWATSPSEGAAGLGLLRPSSQALVVVALVDLHQTCTPSLPMATHLLANTLDELYPTGERPLVVRCFGVEGEGSADPELVIDSSDGNGAADGGAGVTVVPKMDNPGAFIEALVAEVVGGLLGEFSDLATSLESSNGMALLQQQSLPPLSLATSIPLSSTPNQSRSSTPVPQFSLLRGETLPVGRSSSPLARADPSPGSRQHQQLGNGHPSTPNFSASPTGRPEMLRSATSSTLRNGVAPPPEAPVGPVKTSFGGVGRKRGPSATASPTPSAPSPSPQTSSTSPAATALPLAAARLASLLGALHLLSGRLGDAQQSFLDALLQFSKLPATAAASAAAMAGGAGDPLWHGATLEGLATAAALIECKPKSPSLPAKDGAAAAPSPAHEVISGHLDSALAMYHRASPTYSPTGENPFPTLYTNAALRHARLLLVIRQRGPLTPLSQPFLRLAPAPTDGPCPNPSVAKHVVGQLATHAHGPWLVLLPPSDRLAALRIVVGVFRSVGMRRKEGVFARMVVACLGEMIVLSRISSAAAATPGAADSAVGVRFEDGKEGNDALLELMDRYLVAYGVDVEADGGVFAGRDEREVKEIRAGPKGSAAGEGEAQIGWPELQMRALRDSIGLAEVLPDHHSVVSYALTMLRTLHGFISPGEQAHLSTVFGRALATARRRGELVEGERLRFWAGWVVMSMELPSLPAASVPVQHDFEDRELGPSAAAGAVRDPFLFNPRMVARLGASAVVQNESFDVFVTLQNPFAFPLEIQNIRLSTAGPDIVCDPHPLLLAANSVQSFKVSAFAAQAGTLTIKGCVVRLTDGSEAEFLLPVHDAAEEKRQRKRASQKADGQRALKLSGIQRVLGERAKRESRETSNGGSSTPADGSSTREPEATYIQCQGLPEQPTMRIRGTSLTHGAMMLYAGEETQIRITLENVGHLPVDFVKLSFQDSTSGPIEAALAEGELSAGEAYELESDLVHQPVFRWSPPASPLLIPPRGRHTLYVTCFGKVGCAWGSIQVIYGTLDRGTDPRPPTFHTRQIAFPILMSVYHTLECTALNVLRIPTLAATPPSPADRASAADPPSSSASAAMARGSSVSTLARALEDDKDRDFCLVAVDVRNTYVQPFEVSFRRKAAAGAGADDETALLSTRLISPGSTERIVLPVRRFLLDAAKVGARIPALGDRQFVLSKAKLSEAEQLRMQTLFWYREELMGLVEAVWHEPGSARNGVLPLRAQSLTEPMLEVLRADEVVIRLAVDGLPTAGADDAAAGATPQSNTFFDVVVRVRNRLSRPLAPVVHLAPATFAPPSSWAHTPSTALPPSPSPAHGLAPSPPDANLTSTTQYFVYSGLQVQIPACRVLESGAEVELRFRVGVLAKGDVAFRACVEELAPIGRRSRRKLLAEEAGGTARASAGKTRAGATPAGGVWFSDPLTVGIE